MNRYKNNLEILKRLDTFLHKYPEMRFIQALWALNIVDNSDRFYEESSYTLKKMPKLYKSI